ncbi:unnamed protein product, partial [Ectocarpus sp. 8 AP-2014]
PQPCAPRSTPPTSASNPALRSGRRMSFRWATETAGSWTATIARNQLNTARLRASPLCTNMWDMRLNTHLNGYAAPDAVALPPPAGEESAASAAAAAAAASPPSSTTPSLPLASSIAGLSVPEAFSSSPASSAKHSSGLRCIARPI